MSAIWGTVSFTGAVQAWAGDVMREKYEKGCRLDRIEDIRDSECYMGCGIQYITAQSQREELPVYDREHGLWMTVDCLLDNREELMGKLHTEEPLPDGRLMYLAYLKWGIDCLSHCRGLFAIAVYDRRKGALYLGTDQTASRCLYYYRHEDGITFSSLIDPVRRLHTEIGGNPSYIRDFLTAPGLMPNISSVETPYAGIFKLNPGTIMTLTASGQEERTYWQPSFSFPAAGQWKDGGPGRKAEAYGACFGRLYREAVENALYTVGEVGIALSSGLDSASVGALAALALEKREKALHTYTYVPSETPVPDRIRGHVLDEQDDVIKLTKMYPNMKPSFLNNRGRNCCEELPRFLDILEIPYKAFVNMPNLGEIYEQAYQAGCRVVLTGQMGNATVSNGYIDDVLYDLYSGKHYLTCLRYLNRYCIGAKESRKRALRGIRRCFANADKEYKIKEFTYKPDNPFLREDILKDDSLKERLKEAGFITTARLPVPAPVYRKNLYRKAMYTYLGEMETKMGLYYGLVIRDPTRDMRIISFCYHMPYRYFAYMGTPRWLLRGNLREILPSGLVDNWLRYGVQNSDWLSRIGRDWERLKPEIAECLEQEKLPSLADKDKALQFLQDWDGSLSYKEEEKMQYLMFLYVMSSYLGRE